MREGRGYPAAQAVADYERWINGSAGPRLANMPAPPSREEIRSHLRDKNLACWCPVGQACHADVLLKLANSRD